MSTHIYSDDATQSINTEIQSINTEIASIKSQVNKLAGELEAQGAVTGNWQSGTGDSGETGANLCVIGSDGVRKKLLSFLIRIANLADGANITVKMFMQINGREEKFYSKTFVKGTDPNGLLIVNSVMGIHRAIRVEVQSDNASDNGKTIDYDFMLEAM